MEATANSGTASWSNAEQEAATTESEAARGPKHRHRLRGEVSVRTETFRHSAGVEFLCGICCVPDWLCSAGYDPNPQLRRCVSSHLDEVRGRGVRLDRAASLRSQPSGHQMHLPLRHTPSSQRLPQRPQLSSSQPVLVQIPPQSVNPSSQTRVHIPALQVDRVACGRVVQSVA